MRVCIFRWDTYPFCIIYIYSHALAAGLFCIVWHYFESWDELCTSSTVWMELAPNLGDKPAQTSHPNLLCDTRTHDSHLPIHSPMRLTPWIKAIPTTRTRTPTRHVLVNTQHMSTNSTEHRLLPPLVFPPELDCVCGKAAVAGYTGVEGVAAGHFDGDDVEWG